MELSEFGCEVKILVWVDDYLKISEYTLELTNELRKIIEKYDKHSVLKIEKK